MALSFEKIVDLTSNKIKPLSKNGIDISNQFIDNLSRIINYQILLGFYEHYYGALKTIAKSFVNDIALDYIFGELFDKIRTYCNETKY